MQSDYKIDDYIFHCVCRDSLCKSFISIEEDGSMTFTTPIFFKLDTEHFKRFDSINPWTYLKRLIFLILNEKPIPFVYDTMFTEEDAIKQVALLNTKDSFSFYEENELYMLNSNDITLVNQKELSFFDKFNFIRYGYMKFLVIVNWFEGERTIDFLAI